MNLIEAPRMDSELLERLGSLISCNLTRMVMKRDKISGKQLRSGLGLRVRTGQAPRPLPGQDPRPGPPGRIPGQDPGLGDPSMKFPGRIPGQVPESRLELPRAAR
ncbi:hypothetical protein Dimus_038179 [Dionaea muscipula]